MPALSAIDRFRALVNDISRLYLKTRETQVRFAWETGRRIVEEEQNGEIRARYGAKLIPELSRSLSDKYGPGFSARTLHTMRQFFRSHPIVPAPAQLAWGDYLELMPVRDENLRKRLEQRAIKEGLKTRDLRRLVRKVQTGSDSNPAPQTALKRPADIELDTFSLSPLRVKLPDNQVLVDCGFFVSWPVKKEELAGLKITDKPSYTYGATIDRVIDGDTLLVLIEVGFGIIVRDRLRLRGVDAPELGTPEGDRAKKFVEKFLPAGSTVVIKTHKCQTDVYGRFVADVFYREGAPDAEAVLAGAVYLNQQLLDEGLAMRMAG
ncbi:MAG: DUF1016 N-terminal domain-containing protein [Patescibacteria group bacterium]|nr:DUF1016 N-terminal domain-containing protein [Patescibacteria group bacterium]